MTAKQARAAIRKARAVMAGVIFYDHGDPQYVQISKKDALAMFDVDDVPELSGNCALVIVKGDTAYIN